MVTFVVILETTLSGRREKAEARVGGINEETKGRKARESEDERLYPRRIIIQNVITIFLITLYSNWSLRNEVA